MSGKSKNVLYIKLPINVAFSLAIAFKPLEYSQNVTGQYYVIDVLKLAL